MKHRSTRLQWMAAFFLLSSCGILLAAGPNAWDRFRGPNGTGVAETKGLPVEFGPMTNVVWKTEVPVGYSSPILAGDRIFLTGAEGKTLLTLCLERSTGKILWRREAPRDREEKLDARNNPASPSPAVDDKNVYVFFPDFGMISYDFDGKERWRAPLGPFNNSYGMGASPVVARDKVILVCDQHLHSFIVALGKDDGRVRWKVDRPEATSGHSTPVLYQPTDGPLQVIAPGSFYLTAYSVETGEKIWWVGGLSFEMKSTPVLADGTVFINGYGTPLNQPENQTPVAAFDEVKARFDADKDGRISTTEMNDKSAQLTFAVADLDGDSHLTGEEWGYYRAAMASPNGLLAIRVGGRGDLTATHTVWKYHKAIPQLPSPLLYKNVLYMVNDGGIVTSLNPSTGAVLAQGRLKGAIDKYFASPVAADDKILFVSESGKVAVVRPDSPAPTGRGGGAPRHEPDSSLEVMAVNDLDEPCYATPAIADRRIYLRTRGALYCFGKRALPAE